MIRYCVHPPGYLYIQFFYRIWRDKTFHFNFRLRISVDANESVQYVILNLLSQPKETIKTYWNFKLKYIEICFVLFKQSKQMIRLNAIENLILI